MRKQNGLTLTELLIVLAITLFLLTCINPILKINWRKRGRVVCGTNLKGLGTAMFVYSNDYDDEYPKLGSGPWSKELGYNFDDEKISASNFEGPCTITSSLYMLVRESDVSPKSFICTETTPDRRSVRPEKYSEFDGQNSKNLDIVELWDFGPEPHKHIGYAYHNPYSKYPAGSWLPASFATMADMSPWFSNGDIQPPQTGENAPQVIRLTDPTTWKYGLSLNHQYNNKRYSEGHNVLFADGHTSYEKQPNVGVNGDNIYTFWSTEDNPIKQDIQGGTAPTSRSPENNAKSSNDSFLAI
ncbi:MAG: type II secretion system protein [Planctomycetota bacterium]|jgi:prepilin-type N-terminal cleavage/methylation domain-containing protein/prepilin-type processing-associated H-X9-DG protein